jgi:hypothetical protein
MPAGPSFFYTLAWNLLNHRHPIPDVRFGDEKVSAGLVIANSSRKRTIYPVTLFKLAAIELAKPTLINGAFDR